MTAKELVDIDVDLILLRYGRAAVLKALAHRVGMSEEDLAREIDRLRVAKESAARKKKSVSEVLPHWQRRNTLGKRYRARFVPLQKDR